MIHLVLDEGIVFLTPLATAILLLLSAVRIVVPWFSTCETGDLAQVLLHRRCTMLELAVVVTTTSMVVVVLVAMVVVMVMAVVLAPRVLMAFSMWW